MLIIIPHRPSCSRGKNNSLIDFSCWQQSPPWLTVRNIFVSLRRCSPRLTTLVTTRGTIPSNTKRRVVSCRKKQAAESTPVLQTRPNWSRDRFITTHRMGHRYRSAGQPTSLEAKLLELIFLHLHLFLLRSRGRSSGSPSSHRPQNHRRKMRPRIHHRSSDRKRSCSINRLERSRIENTD